MIKITSRLHSGCPLTVPPAAGLVAVGILEQAAWRAVKATTGANRLLTTAPQAGTVPCSRVAAQPATSKASLGSPHSTSFKPPPSSVGHPCWQRQSGSLVREVAASVCASVYLPCCRPAAPDLPGVAGCRNPCRAYGGRPAVSGKPYGRHYSVTVLQGTSIIKAVRKLLGT